MIDKKALATKWEFATEPDGSMQGWNSSSIGLFAEASLRNFVRETIQNSLDARAEGQALVEIRFVEREIKPEEFPNRSALQDVLDLCKDDPNNKQKETKNSLDEIGWAHKFLKRSFIPVLSVEDYGTTGMTGPHLKDTSNFFKYMKGEGLSGGEGRRGSHGIGKAAPLAVSLLRTVIVSTVWQRSEQEKELLIQGRATFKSYKEQDEEKPRKGTGYWGVDDFKPISLNPEHNRSKYKLTEDYAWLFRKEVGTSVHILGWNPRSKDWKNEFHWGHVVLGFAAINFFSAIDKNLVKIVVQRKGNQIDFPLEKETLAKVLYLKPVEKAMRNKVIGDIENLENARMYFACLKEYDQSVEVNVKYLGKCQIRIKVMEGEEKAPNRFAVMRKDMLITDDISRVNFPQSDYHPFAGLFECLEEKGMNLLRAMEPAAHDKLAPSLLKENPEKGAEIIKSLKEELAKVAGEYAARKYKTTSPLEFTRKFFSSLGQDNKEDLYSNAGFTLEAVPARKRRKSNGVKDVTSRKTKKGPRLVGLRQVRVVKQGKRSVLVYMTPSKTTEAHLLVYEVGDDGKKIEPFAILTTSEGVVSPRGGIQLTLKRGARQDPPIKLLLEREIVGGLRFEAEVMPSEGQGEGNETPKE